MDVFFFLHVYGPFMAILFARVANHSKGFILPGHGACHIIMCDS